MSRFALGMTGGVGVGRDHRSRADLAAKR
jgi:hypothetical protein